MDTNKKFFIIKKRKFLGTESFAIHDSNMYDLTTAVKKLLALDTLNEDKKTTSYHLQEVCFSEVEKPLELTKEMEVKKNGEDINLDDMPF